MIFLLFVLLLAVPAGFLVAWLARDEIIEGRRYFKVIILISFILMFLFIKYEYVVISLGFIAISTSISLLKSYDSKWAVLRKR